MIDGEQIDNWEGGPNGETLEELCAPISAKKMPRSKLFGTGNCALTEEQAELEGRRRAGLAMVNTIRRHKKKSPIG